MAAPARMLRLLQGDVGAGKTVVAMLALLDAVEAGAQGALMAPTEILARQHMAALDAARESRRRAHGDAHRPRAGRAARADAGGAGKRARSTSSSARMRCSRKTWRSAISALAVVDEQHRFGVHQRMKLQGKGEQARRRAGDDGDAHPAHAGAHRLWRHGCLAADRTARRAASRWTRACSPPTASTKWWSICAAPLRSGARAYWVCPLVEESEKSRSRRRRRIARRCCGRRWARRSASCTAA